MKIRRIILCFFLEGRSLRWVPIILAISPCVTGTAQSPAVGHTPAAAEAAARAAPDVSVVGVGEAKQAKKGAAREETVFGIEQDFERPVPVPEGVLELLRTDSLVAEMCLRDSDRTADDIQVDWFDASRIHLTGPAETDYVVKVHNFWKADADSGCLYGANVGPFWVVRKTRRGYQMLLSVSTLGLSVLRSRTNGYRDVSAGAVVSGKAVFVIFKFSGRRYRRFETRVEEIK